MIMGALSSSVAVAQGSGQGFEDISRDLTNLSPRVQCFGYVGLKDAGDSTYELQNARRLGWDIRDIDRSIAASIESLTTGFSPEFSMGTYSSRLTDLYGQAGLLSMASPVDRRRIAQILNTGRQIPVPKVKNYDDERDRGELITASIVQTCAEEYFAAAFNIGRPKGKDAYISLRDRWIREQRWPSTGVTYYPKSLAALNYLVSRELLAQGRVEEAFALATDPVMKWAVRNIQYASMFQASFYELGVGTPRSVTAAIAIHEAGGARLDIVQSAALKASLGRNAEAVKDLEGVFKGSTKRSRPYLAADRLYTKLTGAAYVERPDVKVPYTNPDGQSFYNLIASLPLAFMAFCSKSPGACFHEPAKSAGPDVAEQIRESMVQSQKNMDQWNDWMSVGKD